MKTLFLVLMATALYVGYQGERASTSGGYVGFKIVAALLVAAAFFTVVSFDRDRVKNTSLPQTVKDAMWPVLVPSDLPAVDGFYPVQYRDRKGNVSYGVAEMVSGHFINMRRHTILAVGRRYETVEQIITDTNPLH